MDDLDSVCNSAEEQFSKATEFLARNHDNPSLKSSLLQFYGLYKQASVGDCNTKRPGLFQLTAKAKWDSWNKLQGTTAEQAMEQYVALLTATIPSWQEAAKKESWVSVSAHQVPIENLIADDEKQIQDYIKEGDVNSFQEHLKGCSLDDQLNDLDESGLGLIHWAADRNQLEILRVLLDIPGVSINLQDSDGQTALHYASSCGHRDSLQLLLAKGADKSIQNSDGETALDIAYDDTIAQMLK